MGKKSMWKKIVWAAVVLALVYGNTSVAFATEADKVVISENDVEPEGTTAALYGCKDISESVEYNVEDKISRWFYLTAFNDTDQAMELTITSSNPELADVVYPEDKHILIKAEDEEYLAIEYKCYAPGTTQFVVQMGEFTYTIPCFGYKEVAASLKSVKQIDYNTIEIEWEPISYVSGYRIMRAVYDDRYDGGEGYEEVARVSGASATKTTIDIWDWSETYSYKVLIYMESGGKHFLPDDYYSVEWRALKMEKLSTSITSVKAADKDKISISWAAAEGAQTYYLYRSTKKSNGYKLIYTGDASTLEYTDTVSAGVTYYYKMCVQYPEFMSQDSMTVSKMLPKSAKVTQKGISLTGMVLVGEQYDGNWADSDSVYYYTAGDKLNVVYPGNNCFRIYTLNSSFKVIKTKKVSVKFDYWGGFYAADDGNFYVVVGYSNPNESRKKTVIKVIKYNKNWKKGKTATIKGGAKNGFEGIYTPFDAGNCAMDMQGDVLYIHTCRTMFKHADGLRHQSNISFAVNTKNMKAVATQDAYCSHSFNQFARFDGNDLYLLDHGDAYPRSVCLSKVSDYGTDRETTSEYNLFNLKGITGENYTGCTVGGMEIGEKNVLVCGAAHPHYSKIKGVSGSDFNYEYNVFLLVTDKESGETSVKWLTQNNPKTTNVEITGARMVKLDDNRYAVMYIAEKNNVSTLHYVVVDGDGTKIYSKKYKNYLFGTGSQPIVYKGRVVWMASERANSNKMYAIPALTK